jgi:hypothetical protein
LPERQVINLLQEQPHHNDCIGVNEGTAPAARPAFAAFDPLGGEIIPQADGQAASIGKFTIIPVPVHYLFEKVSMYYTFI